MKINRASGKNSRVCSLCVCLHPSPLPSSGRNFISKGLTRKKGQVYCQRVKSKLGNGEPAEWGHNNRRKLAGDKWGKLPSLQVWWNVLLIGVGGERATNLTENHGRGEPKGWNGLPTHPCQLGTACAGGPGESPAERGCCCSRASHRAWNIGSAPCVSNCSGVLIAMQYSCELL